MLKVPSGCVDAAWAMIKATFIEFSRPSKGGVSAEYTRIAKVSDQSNYIAMPPSTEITWPVM
jgi:hypothetical protein